MIARRPAPVRAGGRPGSYGPRSNPRPEAALRRLARHWCRCRTRHVPEVFCL